jgi:hypothetical protein
MHKSIAAATAAGLAVAALWAGITHLSGWSLGFLALFIGTAVGLAFRFAAKDRTSTSSGLIAAAIALACILVGKYASASIYAHQRIAESASDESLDIDEAVTCEIADGLVAHYEDADVELDWTDADYETAATSYPAGIWHEAEQQFASLTDDEKALRRAEFDEHTAAETESASGTISLIYFLFSFGPTGLVILGLSVAGAYKIASGHEKTGDDTPAETPSTFTAGSPLRGMPAAHAVQPQRDAA